MRGVYNHMARGHIKFVCDRVVFIRARFIHLAVLWNYNVTITHLKQWFTRGYVNDMTCIDTIARELVVTI
jgi:hypothetical protein